MATEETQILNGPGESVLREAFFQGTMVFLTFKRTASERVQRNVFITGLRNNRTNLDNTLNWREIWGHIDPYPKVTPNEYFHGWYNWGARTGRIDAWSETPFP